MGKVFLLTFPFIEQAISHPIRLGQIVQRNPCSSDCPDAALLAAQRFAFLSPSSEVINLRLRLASFI